MTNALIYIEGSDLCVYQHGDGDPKSLSAILSRFNAQFVNERGPKDVGYKVAQLLFRLLDHAGEPVSKFQLERFIGYGVYKRGADNMPTADHVYLLKGNGAVEIEK